MPRELSKNAATLSASVVQYNEKLIAERRASSLVASMEKLLAGRRRPMALGRAPKSAARAKGSLLMTSQYRISKP